MGLRNNISEQKQHGVFYTPREVVDTILERVSGGKLQGKKLCDPSCGSGNFLVAAVEKILAKKTKHSHLEKQLQENICGFDCNPDALKECKTRLNSILRTHGMTDINWNLRLMDSTEHNNIAPFAGTFDFVVGNPPYIRIQHLPLHTRKQITKQWSSAAYGCSDIYMAFFDIGLELLNEHGRLGYITPNGYTKTDAGKPLRKLLSSKKLVSELADFGTHQIFEGATTYTLITILDKAGNDGLIRLSRHDGITLQDSGYMAQKQLDRPQWDLCGVKEYDRLQRIRSKGVPLHEVADIHVGVQTLADDVFILEHQSTEGKYVVCKTADNNIVRLEKESVLPILKVSVMKNGKDPKQRVIICPYRRESLHKPTLIPEDEMRQQFPKTFAYLQIHKQRLLMRDKGAFANAWYAYGREMNLQKTLGDKILTAPLNRAPNFMKCPAPHYTFYSGYSIKIKNGNISEDDLLAQLNSDNMDFFIRHAGRDYRSGWKSYTKAFIKDFGIITKNPQNLWSV